MSKPQANTRGTYQTPHMDKPEGFTIKRVEGNLCYAVYDHHTDGVTQPFIWRFKDGLNKYHDWPSKAA